MVKPVKTSASGNVGGDHAGAPQEFSDDKLDSRGIEQLRTAGRFHDRVVHDVRKFVGVEKFGDHGGVSAIAEHADFHRGDVAILGQDFELFAQLRAGSVVNRLHAFGALYRE